MEESVLIIYRALKKYSERWNADDVNLILSTIDLWLELYRIKDRDASQEEAFQRATRSMKNCIRAFEFTVIHEVEDYATIENAQILLGM